MSLYCYLKRREPKPGKTPPFSWVGYFCLFWGSFLLVAVSYPLVEYQLRYAPHFVPLLNPQADAATPSASMDYTNVANWFSFAPPSLSPSSPSSPWWLSIPKLGINQAVVIPGGEDLKQSLVQYPESAPPGRVGKTIVFGHSVLPQFFDPQNYLTIFSLLYKLSPGDLIVASDGKGEYTYRVWRMFETTAEDTTVLRQRFDDAFLVLITCTPPGTYLRRLVVEAKLER